jgi:hypothetical protein
MNRVGRVPAALVALSVLSLPAAYRPRYRIELRSELNDLPRGQQLAYALRIVLRSATLRSALTRYRPTIGETLMPAKPSNYSTSALRHRQNTGDVGHTVLGADERVTARSRWKLVGLPFVLALIGILLTQWGPVPGLGAFLVLGAMAAVVPIGLRLFNDMFT